MIGQRYYGLHDITVCAAALFAIFLHRQPVSAFFARGVAAATWRSCQQTAACSMSTSDEEDSPLSFRIKYDETGVADDSFDAPVGPLPTVPSKINFGDETPQNVIYDLWVVGSGTLGEMIVKVWKEKYPDARITAETLTTARHDGLLDMDVLPRLREDRNFTVDMRTAKNVVVCIPPSASEIYDIEVGDAAVLWAGIAGGGALVYTSSIGVYGESSGNTVTEDFRVDTRSMRSSRLLAAEEAILSRGGNVLRLAGLYTETRGPHTFWLKKAAKGEIIESNADGLVNMLHYEDAARATVAAVETGATKKIFLAVDDEPVTKREICASALASNLFPDAPMPEFESEIGSQGKICDDSKSRAAMGWEPQYKSFRSYMRRIVGGDLSVPNVGTRTKKATSAEGEGEGGGEGEEGKSVLWLGSDDDDLFAI